MPIPPRFLGIRSCLAANILLRYVCNMDDPVGARTGTHTRVRYVAVLGLRDGHMAASVQTQLGRLATTATIAGYASTNVSHLPVRQLPRIRTRYYVASPLVLVEVQERRGKERGGEGNAYAGIEGT